MQGQPYVDGVEWLVLEDESTGLAMYRTGQIDCGPWHWWAVRQADLESLKKSHPHLLYRDFLSIVPSGITMRTDQPPFNDVRVRRAISQALDRQAIIEAVYLRGEADPGDWPRSEPSGRCPSISSGRAQNTISMIPRKPSACWRKPGIPRA